MIYAIYLIVLFFGFISFQTYFRIEKENKYHLNYLLYHFITQFIIALNLSFYISMNLSAPILLISVVRVCSVMFLVLQVSSILKQDKVKMRGLDIGILSAIIIVNILNDYELKLLPTSFENGANSGFFELGVSYFKGKEDVLVCIALAGIYYSVLLLKSFLSIDNTNLILDKTKRKLKKWMRMYVLLFILNFLFVLFVLALILMNLYSYPLGLFNKLLFLSSFLVLASIPILLRGLTSIKKTKPLNTKQFEIIEHYFKNYNYHLDPSFNLSKLSLALELRNDIVRDCIKEHALMSFPVYTNTYRIKHACQLMQDGYLTNFSMLSLAEESGFSSQQSFNRSFKNVMSLTPSTYLNSINLK